MSFEEQIHEECRREGLALAECAYHYRSATLYRQKNTMNARYKRLLLALAAVASIFLVRWTGLDAGLIDEALNAAVEAFVEEPASEEPIGTETEVTPSSVVEPIHTVGGN